jgi:hypothetical protein
LDVLFKLVILFFCLPRQQKGVKKKIARGNLKKNITGGNAKLTYFGGDKNLLTHKIKNN